MSRSATIIGEAKDIFGQTWDVREERPTKHGFAVFFGWPQSTKRGQGGGGPRVIVTDKLAGYLEAHRHQPQNIDLPIGRTTIKRLRKLLDMDWITDNRLWWESHKNDLLGSTLEDFCQRHGKSQGAASQWRATYMHEPDSE